MTEPTTSTINAIVAFLSAGALTLLGVDYYALLWSLVGSLLAASQADKMGRLKACIFVAASTLIGAAIGNGMVALFSTSPANRPVMVLFSLTSGFGAQALLVGMLKAALNRISLWGGANGPTA